MENDPSTGYDLTEGAVEEVTVPKEQYGVTETGLGNVAINGYRENEDSPSDTSGINGGEGAGHELANNSNSEKTKLAEGKNTTPNKNSGRRGHPMKQVKANLSQQGRLNAKKPMSPEQKRLRRKKRKR